MRDIYDTLLIYNLNICAIYSKKYLSSHTKQLTSDIIIHNFNKLTAMARSLLITIIKKY
jgi:hypothetical protein